MTDNNRPHTGGVTGPHTHRQTDMTDNNRPHTGGVTGPHTHRQT